MSRNIILSAKSVCKRYGGGEPVLRDISLDIYEGDFTIIMGASGAGKSTLLYALSGMDTITSGKVFYKDEEISSFREKQMAKLRSEEFGFIFQQPHLVSSLTLFENVAVAGYLDKKKSTGDTRNLVAALMERMHINEVKNRFPAQVSGGEAQRTAIARAVIRKPGLLFADEPTGALNRRNTDEVLDLLTTLNHEGQSILMVTHDLRCAVRGNRLLYLEDGKLAGDRMLSPYTPEQGRERESELTDWLTGLGW